VFLTSTIATHFTCGDHQKPHQLYELFTAGVVIKHLKNDHEHLWGVITEHQMGANNEQLIGGYHWKPHRARGWEGNI